ncbi:RNA methyltransferase, partial [Candidatus Dependentiae bacterium]|nr:RNA methyltransferase [Candidatus Dependentiae bacterium]
IYTTRPTPKSWDLIASLLTKDIQIQYVPRDSLHKLAGTTDHQSVVAWATPFVKRKKFFEPSKNPFLVLLDGIQDPRNLGAIIRSASCTGATGMILCGKNSAPLNATAFKSSAGLAEYMEIYEAPTAVAAAQELKKAGYSLYLATLKGADAMTLTYKEPLCLVIGNEAVGISRNVLPFGEEISIPQRSKDISYNASVAAGILLFIISYGSGRIKPIPLASKQPPKIK